MREISAEYYDRLWQSMRILSDWIDRAKRAAEKVISGRARYKKIEDATGVPWAIVGVIALMESDCDFSRGLHNGQRWDRKTTMVPIGKGPFASWEDAAIDALGGKKKLESIAGLAEFLERFNGLGYANRGVNSPYLWSGSNHGVGVGKYVADRKYDSEAVSSQVGAMVALRAIIDAGAWSPKIVDEKTDPIPNDYCGPRWRFGARGDAILALQRALAFSGCDPGPIDGICGARTADAYRQATGDYLSGDPADKRIPAVEYRRRVGQAAKVLSDQVAQLGAAIGDLRELV